MDRSPREELAVLAAELRQHLEWQGLLGVHGLPEGDALPPVTAPPVPRPSPRKPSVPQPAIAEPQVAEPQVAAPGHGAAWAALGVGEPLRSLEAVRTELGDCRRCRLCESRQKIVFGVGDPNADLVIVGEGPGAREDQVGEPFVGPAGQMLDRMLQHVLGLSRHQVYILNVVKCRPPRNRTPQPDEIAACKPFLDGQLAALAPKVILAMGRPATQTLMETGRGIKAMRGRWQLWQGRTALMPTFHPAYLLRTPEDKRYTFEDLKAVRVRYDELGGKR